MAKEYGRLKIVRRKLVRYRVREATGGRGIHQRPRIPLARSRFSHATPNRPTVLVAAFGLLCLCLAGCHDGPMYGLKAANPYFVYKEWGDDAAYGVTDHQRRQELQKLADSVAGLPTDRQQYWMRHLEQLMQHDPNPEMRRIAVQTAGRMTIPEAGAVIDRGLDDDVVKVRMEACRALAKRQDEDASRLLATVIGSDPDPDVKHAAMAALGDHRNRIASDALRLALRDRDPATQDLAMRSLRGVTGKDYGDNPDVWIAALDGNEVDERPQGWSDRLRNLF